MWTTAKHGLARQSLEVMHQWPKDKHPSPLLVRGIQVLSQYDDL